MMTAFVPLAARGAPLSHALPLLRVIRLRDRGMWMFYPGHWQSQTEKANIVPEEDTPDICEIVRHCHQSFAPKTVWRQSGKAFLQSRHSSLRSLC